MFLVYYPSSRNEKNMVNIFSSAVWSAWSSTTTTSVRPPTLCGTKVCGGGHMTEGAVFTTRDHLKDSRTNRKEKTENFGMGPTPGSVYEARVERRSHAESRWPISSFRLIDRTSQGALHEQQGQHPRGADHCPVPAATFWPTSDVLSAIISVILGERGREWDGRGLSILGVCLVCDCAWWGRHFHGECDSREKP